MKILVVSAALLLFAVLSTCFSLTLLLIIKYYKYTLKATDTNQFRDDAIYNLGLSYQKLGDDEKAEEYYKRFVNTYSAS